MNAIKVVIRRRRWLAVVVLIFLIVGTFVFVQTSPSIARQRAANQLRKMGLTVGVESEREAGLKGWWNDLKRIWSQRNLEPPSLWKEQVSLISSEVENLDRFASVLVRFRSRSIRMVSCLQLNDLSVLKRLPDLKEVEVSNCPGITDMAWLSEVPKLRTLTISNLPGLTGIPSVKSASKVKKLRVTECNGITDFGHLRDFTGLTLLSLSDSPNLQNTDALRGLSKLEHLFLSDCTGLSDVTGLHSLKSLRFVRLNGCIKLSPEAVAALRAALPGAEEDYP